MAGKPSFLKAIRTLSGCDEKQAEKVIEVYLKERILKADVVTGQYNVTHGVFMDRDVLWNAINS